jgi:hypothetical protein
MAPAGGVVVGVGSPVSGAVCSLSPSLSLLLSLEEEEEWVWSDDESSVLSSSEEELSVDRVSSEIKGIGNKSVRDYIRD